MPHPFDIGATLPSAEQADELLILAKLGGDTPTDSTASVYLPAVSAASVIQLANQMYTTHRLTVRDAHTLACPASGLTFVPIPKGSGRYAGLLSVDLPPSLKRGDQYAIVVRQVTSVRAAATRDLAEPVNAFSKPDLATRWR